MPRPTQPTNAADYTHGYEDCANDVAAVITEMEVNREYFTTKNFIKRFNEVRKARFNKAK